MTADDVLNLQFAKDLIGPNFFPHTTVLMVGWERNSHVSAPQSLADKLSATHEFSQKETELKTRPEFATIIQRQGRFKRLGVFAPGDRTQATVDVHSPLSLFDEIWENRASAATLLIQEEVCVQPRSLNMTTVGAALDKRLSQKIKEMEEERDYLDAELQGHLDPNTELEVMKDIEALEEQIRAWMTW